jgi:hypothetical protein
MTETQAPMITLTGFFTSQAWLRGKTLSEIERLLGYGLGRLSTRGAAVYAFTRVPDDWEFELAGYTNVSGGLKVDASWAAADRAAAPYLNKWGLKSSQARLKENARATMTIHGGNRLIKVKPLIDGNNYPPGLGIPQWAVSDSAAQRHTLTGKLLFVLQPGTVYP